VSAAAARRLLAEFTGTGLLVAVVVGSGIAASRLTGDGALRLLVCSVVTGAGLAVLITVLAPAGGAQFNPVVTGSDWLLARRTARGYGAGEALAVMGCQVAGAVGGAALADVMFSVPALAASGTRRGGAGVLPGEAVATAGLLLVVTGLARTGQGRHAAWAAGAWIGAAQVFTSSTSFANPAVTVGRSLTDTYAGIAPASAPAFVAAQVAGGALGAALAVALFPARPAVAERSSGGRSSGGAVRVHAQRGPVADRGCAAGPGGGGPGPGDVGGVAARQRAEPGRGAGDG
jgi:glycerol uptake facilitator-like aquaporin